jgi:hypothetical protein
MRSLLDGWSPAVVSLLAAVEILACPRVAASQATGTGTGPGGGRVVGAAVRTVLESAANGEVALDRRATKRLESAQQLLFDGRYADALAAFDAILESGDARGTEMLTSWARHGAAVSEALAGRLSHARTLYDEMLRGSSLFPLADSIEAAVLTSRHPMANALLDRFAETNRSMLAQQYAHSFRALDLLVAGSCTAALAEIARAPDNDRPLPQAIRGSCAAKAGRHAEAAALRDSVLTHPLADPQSWPMIVARGVAFKIH